MVTITAAAVALAPVMVPIPEIALPLKFSREKSQVVGFINAYYLFMQMRIGQVGNESRIIWILSYIQEGVVEIWKNNILDKITNRTLAMQKVKELFVKIRQEFGEFDEESRKVDELRVLEQEGKTIDEYV